MSLAWLLLTVCLGAVHAEAPVARAGPGELEASYGPPAVSVLPRDPHQPYAVPHYAPPEKAYVPVTYSPPEEGSFGIETGYQGFLVPALEAVSSAASGSTPNPLAAINPLATILSASSDLLANTDFSTLYPTLFGSSSLLSKPWFWGIAPKIAASLLKKLGSMLIKFAFVVFLGGGFTVAVCTFTPICTLSFLGFGLTRRSITNSVRNYITQDRLTSLTTYVMEAIEKFRHMQTQNHHDKHSFFKKEKPVKKVSENMTKATKTEVEHDTTDTSVQTTTTKHTHNIHKPEGKEDNNDALPLEQVL